MTLQEIRQAKLKAEEEITRILIALQDETGCRVDRLSYDYEEKVNGRKIVRFKMDVTV